MASVNKAILVGHLGRTPEVRYTPEGTAVCNISVATTSQWKDRNTGERREETEWHRVVFYNRLAEIAGEYLKKGSPVYLEGRLKTRKWQDRQTGQDRYATEIIAEQMQMLGSRNDAAAAGQASAPAAAGAPRPVQSPSVGASADDDIPFASHGAGRAGLCL